MKSKSFTGTLAVLALSAGLTACGTSGQGSNSSAGSTSNTAANQTTGSTGAKTGSKGTVKIGYVTWTEDVADVYLWKHLLEQRGYKVQLTNMQAGPLWLGLSKGGIDFHFDVWLPHTDKTYMNKYKSSLVNLGKWYQGKTRIGLVVPQYVKINSISQLNAHSKEFGNRIVGIDAGAGETQTIEKKVIPAYGLKLKLVNSSSPAMLSALKSAYAKHKPIVVALWSPHWAFSKWKLKYLKDPKGAFGKPGWIQTEANKKWAAQHPTVVKWLKNFKLNQQQLGELEVDINDAKTKDAGVTKWIQSHKSLVNSWFQTS
ncbi:glycine betaine ABC transporter substrate-binding protein [Alicyclobacillus sp. SO9]|uniref:glycine betaine ABC transporter substrate-binding protein n=1 Tax=Alicyclobacillus sp. SO9 TaxID=2665646 RepID=UPI0018E866D7|nr:glycine betaine ABC transporter substrate-binding protein [Alicyclobacillus sp. SO9]QQE79288.1 glycine betaine ABC transporter substrate-binding protein [Alicyclobacillus sp. SO9]